MDEMTLILKGGSFLILTFLGGHLLDLPFFPEKVRVIGIYTKGISLLVLLLGLVCSLIRIIWS